MNRPVVAPLAAIALLSVIALGGCKKDAPTQATAASGQILPGSISDAMVPEDQLTSQPPLAPQTTRPGKATAGANATDAAAANEAAPADAAPAAEPAPAGAPD